MFGKKDPIKTAFKLYRKGKLKAPYDALYLYYDAMTNRGRGAKGHYDFFAQSKLDDNLDDAVRSMRSILPQDLLENFETALAAYQAMTDETDIVETFFDRDLFAADHAAELKDILAAYIAEMQARHVL